MDIKLTFKNESNDTNNSQVVIFQKNTAINLGATAAAPPVAWQVIQNCGRDCTHPFVYPFAITVGAGDAYGNFTPHLPASPGQLFAMTWTQSGDELSLAGGGSSPEEVQVENRLREGAISAMVYKDGQLFATSAHLSPGQTAAFRFNPVIWIGAVSQVTPGQVINEAIASSVTTEISLMGLASADIVMTGGGSGPDAKPFEFHLENAVVA